MELQQELDFDATAGEEPGPVFEQLAFQRGTKVSYHRKAAAAAVKTESAPSRP